MRSVSSFLLRSIAVALAGLSLATAPAAAQVLQGPHFQWASALYSTPVSPALTVASNASALDAAGNSYMAFSYQGDLMLGNTLLPDGRHNGVVQYAPNGQVTWFKDLGLYATVNDVAVDPDGNLVVAGSFNGPIFIDSLSMQAQMTDIFLIKWTSSGRLLWAKQGLAGSNPSVRYLKHIAIDATGNIYATGEADAQSVFGPTAQIGSSLLATSVVSGAVYCAKYTATGDLVWVTGSDNHLFAPSGLAIRGEASGIGLDPTGTGGVVLVGRLPGQLTWGTSTTVIGAGPTNAHNLYWVRLNTTDGQFHSGFSALADPVSPPHLAVDAAGNSYLAQQFSNSFTLNGAAVTLPTATLPGIQNAVYVAKLSPAGTPAWARVFTTRTTNNPFDVRDLALNDSSQLFLAGTVASSDTVNFGAGGVFLPPTLGNTIPFALGLNTTTGVPDWVKGAATGTTRFHVGSSVSANNFGQVVLTGAYSDDAAQFGPWVAPVAGSSPNGAKLFTAMIGLRVPQVVPNTISGTVFIDANANGYRDSTELPAPAGLVLTVSNIGPYAVTDSLGYYRIDFFADTLTLNFGSPLLNYQSQQPIVGPVRVLLPGTVFTRDVPIVPIANRPDGRLTLTAYTDAEPGLPLRYRLTIENTGTAPLAGSTVAVDFDSRLTYVGTSLPGATVSGHRLTTAAPALLPGESRAFDVTFQVPTTTPLAATLTCVANLTVPLDGALADNTSTAPRPVVAARVAHTAEVDHTSLSLPQVAANEWLTYTVRFRNDGTAPVPNVALAATLAGAHIRRGSVQVLASSHPVTFAIGPNTVDFTLNGANLPPYSQNTIGAFGFVSFRVRVQAGLTAGTLIRLDAALTLGAQAPVALSALTRIGGTTGLAATAAATETTLWPNPAREMVSLETAMPGPLAVALLDGVGRVVRTATLPETARRLSVAGLPAGLYTLRATASAPAGGTPITVVRRLSVVAAE